MSNRICGKCGSRKVADAGSYGGSSFFKCETCGQLGMREKFPEMTLFDRITASPEVLADKLTYWQYDPEQSRCGWTNNIIVGELYKNYHEAIAATVAKLKEVTE